MIKFKIKSLIIIFTTFLSALVLMYSCSPEKPMEKRIIFPGEYWPRFNILKFEFPVTESGKSYDFILVLRVNKSFPYEGLPLNMVLNSPSGEERIKEYLLQVKDKNGSFKGTTNGDTCIIELVLKRGLNCSSKGMMKVEIENLNPKLATEGVFSTSLLLVKH